MEINIDVNKLNYWKQAARNILGSKAHVGFKVVSGVKVFSPSTSAALQKIRYRINEITSRERGEYGCFAVFTNYQSAKKFLGDYGTHILLVGYLSCLSGDKHVLWKKLPPNFLKSRYGKGYYAESAGEKELPIESTPKGTVLAEKIHVFGIIE